MVNSKKKIGIITLHGYENYGNKLQNYAAQEVIKKLGFIVETVVIQDIKSNDNKSLKRVSKVIKMPFKEVYKKAAIIISKKMKYYAHKNLIDKRTQIFKEFSKTYLTEKFYSNSNDELRNISNKYDFFITGSDQVWNPIYINKSPIYFLTFTNKSKRIAYAPSFGRSSIPSEYEGEFRSWLLDMAQLSVREEAGARIIKQLTGRKATVLVDPTLMLSKGQWLSISRGALNKPKEKYILTYFLGETTKETQNQIRDIAKQYNLKVVKLVDLNDKETYETGPSEFVDYINSASIFFTDSFHGVVFSILLETPFVVYERISKSASMYSRIETLLDMFDLRFREAQNIKNNEEIFNVDFTHTYPILEQERIKAITYLETAFNEGN